MTHAEPGFGDVKVETLGNGITVVTEGAIATTSSVSVVIGAGSRNESIANAGVASVVGTFAFQSATQRSALAMKRQCDSVGASLSCEVGRETITYSADFLGDKSDTVTTNLLDSVMSPAFKQWEFDDAKATLTTDASAAATVMHELHSGAFRTGLGNTAASYESAAVSLSDASDFMKSFFTGGNTTVVGVGVDHDDLVAIVEKTTENVPTAPASISPATYFGGFESRTGMNTSATSVAIGFEGVSQSGDVAAAAVLERLIASAPAVKYGSTSGASGLKDISVKTINLNYSDSGIFGLHVSSEGEATTSDVSTAVAELKSILGGKIDDDAVAKAKKAAAASVLDLGPAGRAAFYAGQSSTSPVTPEEFAASIEAVSTASVKAVAAKIGASKPVLASAGNIAYAPYASDLGL